MRTGIYLLLLLVNFSLWAQGQRIDGTITDQEGNLIVYARVTTNLNELGARTDENGRFTLFISKDSLSPQKIYVRALGYQPVDSLIDLSRGLNKLRISMSPSSFAPVLVKASRKIRSGIISPSLEKIKAVPVVFGQTDVLKSLTLYPGISGGKEGLSQISVRGGSDDQNLYLLDGATVYNPGHFFGLLSTYNPNIVSSLTLYKDQIPSRYNRRLSSTIKVDTKSGGLVRMRSREVSLLSLSYTDEGSLSSKKDITYGGGLRLAHTALLTLATLPSYLSGKTPLGFAGMYDVNFKVRRSYANNRTLVGSIHSSNDIYGGTIKASTSQETGNGSALLRYGNLATSVQYQLPRNNMDTEWLFTYSAFGNTYRIVEQLGIDGEQQAAFSFQNKSTLKQIKINYSEEKHKTNSINYGAQLEVNLINPTDVSLSFEGGTIEESNTPPPVISSAVYYDWDIKINSFARLLTGVRINAFTYQGISNNVNFTASPSIYLKLNHGQSNLLVGARSTSQTLHAADVASGGLPVKLWLPISEDLPAERDYTFSLNYDYASHSEKTKLSAGLFYRQFYNQVLLPTRQLTFSDQASPDILGKGQGDAYGLEFYIEHPLSNRLLSSCSYTYSRSYRQFNDFNQGARFPFDYDRPHDLFALLHLDLSKKWSISTAFALSSGLPISQPTAFVSTPSGDLNGVVRSYNNARTALYHRADIYIKRKKTNRRGKQTILKFGLYNLYGRRNPVSVSFNRRVSGSTNPQTGLFSINNNISARGLSLFSFLPILSYEIRY